MNARALSLAHTHTCYVSSSIYMYIYISFQLLFSLTQACSQCSKYVHAYVCVFVCVSLLAPRIFSSSSTCQCLRIDIRVYFIIYIYLLHMRRMFAPMFIRALQFQQLYNIQFIRRFELAFTLMNTATTEAIHTQRGSTRENGRGRR